MTGMLASIHCVTRPESIIRQHPGNIVINMQLLSVIVAVSFWAQSVTFYCPWTSSEGRRKGLLILLIPPRRFAQHITNIWWLSNNEMHVCIFSKGYQMKSKSCHISIATLCFCKVQASLSAAPPVSHLASRPHETWQDEMFESQKRFFFSSKLYLFISSE